MERVSVLVNWAYAHVSHVERQHEATGVVVGRMLFETISDGVIEQRNDSMICILRVYSGMMLP